MKARTGGPQHPVSPESTLGVLRSALQATGKAGAGSQGFYSETEQIWKDVESTKKSVYMGQGVGGSLKAVDSGWFPIALSSSKPKVGRLCHPSSKFKEQHMGSKRNNSDPGLEWIGGLKPSVLLWFPSSLPEAQELQAHSAHPGLKHRTSEECTGEWPRGLGRSHQHCSLME